MWNWADVNACGAYDLICHLDQHEGAAAYLQAILTVGVAATTATWALYQGGQRIRDAERRWRAHVDSIVALVDIVDSEVSRLEGILAGSIAGPDDENEMPVSRYLEPATELVARFPRLELPSEEALRGWFDFYWELRIFSAAMRTVWDTRPRPGTQQVFIGDPPDVRAKDQARRVHAAASRVRAACRAARTKPVPPRLLADLGPQDASGGFS